MGFLLDKIKYQKQKPVYIGNSILEDAIVNNRRKVYEESINNQSSNISINVTVNVIYPGKEDTDE